MRHRRKGRVLGRSPSHQRALLRNLASALFLTEGEFAADDPQRPKVPGRIVTTLPKAKEVRPVVEKCITIAKRGLIAEQEAARFATTAERGSDAWRQWRKGRDWADWTKAMAPSVDARRRALRLLGDKKAVRILFESVATRFTDRLGGYTRILKLAKPRLGDAGARAIIEFVGVRDRAASRGPKPEFDGGDADE